MIEATLKIEGMMCSHCEARVNKAVNSIIDSAKVTSSSKKGETTILSENIDMDAVIAAIEKEGYKVLSSESHPYEKKGLFSRK